MAGKRIYFMGVCGTAMGNAALLVRAAGHEVLGSDSNVYPPMSTVLFEAGIQVHEGYDPVRLSSLKPDVVVIGNAMSRGNPEVEWLLESKAIPFTSLPAMLHEQVLRHRRNIVISGTHGKTTTTAIAAFLLRSTGRNPGYLIGGVPQDPRRAATWARSEDPFVIEGTSTTAPSSTSAASLSTTRPMSRSSTTSSLTTRTSSGIWRTCSARSPTSRALFREMDSRS